MKRLILAMIAASSFAIAKLSSDVAEVLKQNLALKKNLNLDSTIAVSKPGNGMEYRIHEVTGNKTTGEVRIIMTSNNIGDKDLKFSYMDKEIIDELGNGYNGFDRSVLKLNGVSDNLYSFPLKNHVDTPYTIEMTIKKFNQEAQYIKYLSLQIMGDIRSQYAVFENLPIKWVEEEIGELSQE